MAARGARETDSGFEKIKDNNLIERLRRQAKKISVRAILFAIALTTVWLILPD
ncbi:MAG: hypothetical protein ACE5I1_20605 [bacterium]